MAKKYIVLHHSVSPDHPTLRNFDDIKRWHVENNGYRDIGYHYVVEYVNGKLTTTQGRAEWDTGAHCISRNKDSIGICIVGNFQDTVPGEELYGVVADLCKDIMTRHTIKEIGGHNQYDATACPGKNFDVERVRQLVKGDDVLNDVKVIVKGKELPGKLIDDRTWVPLRELVEALNNQVTWDEKDRVAVVK